MAIKRGSTPIVLPEELIFMEILTRLSIKSLIQLTLVCRRWYSLILKLGPFHSQLALTSLNNNQNSPSLIINFGTDPLGYLEIINRYGSVFRIDDSVHEMCNAIFCQENSIIQVSDETCTVPAQCVDLVGSVNGLVCLAYVFEPHLYFIWNPLTNSSKVVSKPTRSSFLKYSNSISGFCYDPVNHDFRILNIERIEMQSKLGRPLLRVQVYSCETNTWKEIRDHTLPVSPFKLICNLERKVYVKFDSNPVALVSFDVHDEVFTLLPCPENYINGQNVRNFVNWMGSLGVVVQNGRDEQAVYTIDESSGVVKAVRCS